MTAACDVADWCSNGADTAGGCSLPRRIIGSVCVLDAAWAGDEWEMVRGDGLFSFVSIDRLKRGPESVVASGRTTWRATCSPPVFCFSILALLRLILATHASARCIMRDRPKAASDRSLNQSIAAATVIPTAVETWDTYSLVE